MSFLDGSLADVTEDLLKSEHTFPLIDQAKLTRSPEKKKLLLRKGEF